MSEIQFSNGIPSICSAHPAVLKETFREKSRKVLIETTCNQVNQFGGYTGMTPTQFVAYVRSIAVKNNFPVENIILGGDHLGPNVWQGEPCRNSHAKIDGNGAILCESWLHENSLWIAACT